MNLLALSTLPPIVHIALGLLLLSVLTPIMAGMIARTCVDTSQRPRNIVLSLALFAALSTTLFVLLSLGYAVAFAIISLCVWWTFKDEAAGPDDGY